MPKCEMIVLTDISLIIAIVPRGTADTIVEAAQEAGAQGASIYYAHGVGIRERLGLLGLALEAEKEVINIIVSSDQVNRIFDRMYMAGDFSTPGMGFMWVSPVEKAAGYVPADILAKFAESDRRATARPGDE